MSSSQWQWQRDMVLVYHPVEPLHVLGKSQFPHLVTALLLECLHTILLWQIKETQYQRRKVLRRRARDSFKEHEKFSIFMNVKSVD